jgi:hypothetical protein
MSDWQLKTPITFIIFNRPNTTEKVFEKIREAQPPKLLVIADGPRTDLPGEAEKCAATRAIIERVDWDCEVLKNYSDVNMGCKQRVSSGLNWVFETVEEVIILEDDCVPHPTFFRFCEELLERYRYDERIGMISGDNFQLGRKRTNYSYYFSHFNHIWGWASWKRAWQEYDINMKLWPEINDGEWLQDILGDKIAVKDWELIFESVYQGKIDTWDYQWTFACWTNNFLTLLPIVNLISNIGFGIASTFTIDSNDKRANLPIQGMHFPLNHPLYIIRNTKADEFTYRNFVKAPFIKRVRNKLREFNFGKIKYAKSRSTKI